MDARHFDTLTRALSEAGNRRGLLGLLATLPVLGGLLALLDLDEVDAKGRRRRRKKRHKHGRGRRKHRKKTCKPESNAKTCAGKCGLVKNTCKKSVDCGSCACQSNTACGAGFLCLEDGSCQACDVVDGQDLAAAIASASAGATLYVCPGAYSPITLNKDLTLIGAGEGSEPASNTILDAAQAGRVVEAAEGITVALRRLRITGGQAASGGGVNNSGALSLTACTVTKNDGTSGGGGGLFNNPPGVLTLTDCTVSENAAASGGGFFLNSSGATTLHNTVVRLNTAEAGAGFFVTAGALTLNEGSTVTENTASEIGGGIVVGGPAAVICDGSGSITENTAKVDGGGIYNFGTVTLNETPVTNNDPNNCAGTAITGCSV